MHTLEVMDIPMYLPDPLLIKPRLNKHPIYIRRYNKVLLHLGRILQIHQYFIRITRDPISKHLQQGSAVAPEPLGPCSEDYMRPDIFPCLQSIP
jgi:hypothetical protein